MTAFYKGTDAVMAAELERRQLEVFIVRGLFVPTHNPSNGSARLYSEDEIVRLAVMNEIVRLKVPAVACAEIVRNMKFLTEPFALILYHGLLELVPTSRRDERPSAAGGPDAVYRRPEHADPQIAFEVVPVTKVMDFILDGARTRRGVQVTAAIVVPIDRIERRVRERLGRATAIEVELPPLPTPAPQTAAIDPAAIYARFNKLGSGSAE